MIVLGAKTDYSFLRGYGTPKQWLARCQEVGVKTLGLADYCSTWGHAPFRAAFKDSGVRLLYGVQIPVVTQLDKDPRHSLITLYAKDNLSSLYQAVTLANEQTYYRPRLTWKQIPKDCYVVINKLLRYHFALAKTLDSSMTFVGTYEGDLERLGMRCAVDYSPRFPSPDDRVGFNIFQSISSGQRIGEAEAEGIHLLRVGERAQYVGEVEDFSDVLASTADIPQATLLDMGVTGDKTDVLRKMAIDGAVKLRLMEPFEGSKNLTLLPAAYGERLERELAVISEKNFEDYFFFVADICRWADERMLVGPGRGSAGGSLLCYLLGITHVDPLRFGTLFERFIDVTRSDLPDIDIDFPDTRREEVFEYLKEKYGADKFARLGTLTELGGKSALNAVARATDVPFDVSREVGKWTEGAGQGVVVKFAQVFQQEEVKAILERHPTLSLVEQIDGHISHHGVHASGIVVTNEPVSTYGAIDKHGTLSMDMRTAETQGLVKMDALGLTTLSVIQECCSMIGMDPRDLRKLDYNDLEVFDKVFNADRVTGVFQFEGDAVRRLMKQVKVDKFDDICALASLARPGPLIGGAAAAWVKARNGETAGESLHPSLDSTYGAITYQEQLMSVCRDVAGFDIPSVNGMRRAVAKKDPEKLRGYREQFIRGMMNAAVWLQIHGSVEEENERSKTGEASGTGEQLEGRSEGGGALRQVPHPDVGSGSRIRTSSDSPSPARSGVGNSGERSSQGREQEECLSEQSSHLEQPSSQEAPRSDEVSAWIRSGNLVSGQRDAICQFGDRSRAEDFWEEICEFGSYSFNFSHAVAYGMISYQTSWLKAKFPLEFAVAQLKYAADEDSAKHLLRELIEEGFQYVPFDHARSAASWSIVDGKLYGGFDSIRGIGLRTAERLVVARDRDPDFWIDELTDAMREKVLRGKTPWHSLSYFTDKFASLYKDPNAYRSLSTPKGVKPPIWRIRDIPEEKGEYAFIGRVTKRKHVDANEPERVAKRDGKKFTKDTHFINLTVEDDTGEIGGTINRFKASAFTWLIEEDLSGRDFLFRGNVIEQGRKYVFIEKVLELK